MAAIDDILNKALQGGRLDLEDTIRLFESDEVEKWGTRPTF
ncbi:hypothetical protein HMSSN036_28680 [Paenibacillus macerans]|nr:hypothetical protein HMSSN036_28680 [Paenibacillus macerans]